MPIQYSPLFGTPLTTTITADTTLSGLHHVVLCNNSSDITVTLPAAATYPYRSYFIKKIGSNANIVTIDGNASETIDGSTTVVLYVQYDFLNSLRMEAIGIFFPTACASIRRSSPIPPARV